MIGQHRGQESSESESEEGGGGLAGLGKGLLTNGLGVAGGLMEASGTEVDPNMKRAGNVVGMGSSAFEFMNSFKERGKDPTRAGLGMASSGLDAASNGLDFAGSFFGEDSKEAKGMGIASGGMKALGGGLDMFKGARDFSKAKGVKGKMAAGSGMLGGLMKGASGLFGMLGNAGVDPELMKRLGGGAEAVGGLSGMLGSVLGG